MTVTKAEVDAVQWFHSIELMDGIVSNGLKPLHVLQAEFDAVFKFGVEGKSVLDVGAWDGAYSFAAEERGARDVLATDYFCWVGPGWGSKDGFDLARAARRSTVRDKVIDVNEIDPEAVGKFDVVLFLGVLYHLKEPLSSLERLSAITNEMLVVETETSLDTMLQPVMRFFPGAELNGDGTNWWAPNISCVTAMLQVAGFKTVEAAPNPAYAMPLNPDRGRYIFYARK